MSVKSIFLSTIAAAVVATAAFAGTATIGSSEAEARPRHGHIHGHHNHHRFHRGFYVAPFLTASVYGGPCYWLKLRAAETGSRYWHNRYHDCRGY